MCAEHRGVCVHMWVIVFSLCDIVLACVCVRIYGGVCVCVCDALKKRAHV